jgi:hypothetical protein
MNLVNILNLKIDLRKWKKPFLLNHFNANLYFFFHPFHLEMFMDCRCSHSQNNCLLEFRFKCNQAHNNLITFPIHKIIYNVKVMVKWVLSIQLSHLHRIQHCMNWIIYFQGVHQKHIFIYKSHVKTYFGIINIWNFKMFSNSNFLPILTCSKRFQTYF